MFKGPFSHSHSQSNKCTTDRACRLGIWNGKEFLFFHYDDHRIIFLYRFSSQFLSPMMQREASMDSCQTLHSSQLALQTFRIHLTKWFSCENTRLEFVDYVTHVVSYIRILLACFHIAFGIWPRKVTIKHAISSTGWTR